MQTPADLNAQADGDAARYDKASLHTANPGDDGSNLAPGGDPQAFTALGSNTEGPTDDQPAIVGMNWVDLLTYDLTGDDPVTHFGLWLDDEFRAGFALRTPIDADLDTEFTFGLGPAARNDEA